MLDYTTSGFTFDFEAKVATVEQSITSVVIQDLINTIRTAEENSLGISYSKIADASGKDSLGGVVQTGITLTLLNDWQLKFDDRTGPDFTQCIVSNGNLVGGINDNPIKASNYTQVNVLRSQAGVLVTGGSAVTPQDKSEIASMAADNVWIDSGTSILNSITITGITASTDNIAIASAVWNSSGTSALDNITITGLTASVDNVVIAGTVLSTSTEAFHCHKSLSGTLGYRVDALYHHDVGQWELKDNQLLLYDEAGRVQRTFNLYDKDGNPSLTAVYKRVPVL